MLDTNVMLSTLVSSSRLVAVLLTCLILLAAASDMPVHAKTSRTFYTDAAIASARAKAGKSVATGEADWLAKMSDEELWNFVPPPEQMRAINVHIGHDCPKCGPEITRKGGHYPWLMDRNRPFKVKCPVCSGEFPTNDIKEWHLGGPEGTPESGPGYVDKGIGWLGPDSRRYHFVSYYIFWQRWVRDILGGMGALSQAYLLTDNPVYAHKCAVLLAKVAPEYQRFDYAKQSYHEGIKGIPGRISDRIWSTGDDSKITLAYDAVYPIFATDQGLLGFLKGKGINDPRQTIETNMLHRMVKDVMSGFVAGNQGMHQKTLCHLAIVLPNDDPTKGPTTHEMRDWLMRGAGRVEDLLWNGFFREGLGAESSPSYSSSWCLNFYEIADLLPRIGVDIWSNPKLKKMADVGLDLTVAGEFCPDIGDSGGLKGSKRVAWHGELQGRGFKHYKDPRFAQALAIIGASARSLWDDYFDPAEVEKAVAEHGKEIEWKTRNLGGYGLAVLESGKAPHRRGITMYYGDASGGHGHKDRLNIQMWAYGRPMMPEDGYPFPFTRHDFYNWRGANTHRHYGVTIDDSCQTSQAAGHLNSLAASPEVQLMDASAETAFPGIASLYRRTVSLIDVSPESFYLLDIFRVRGGSQHDYCFHGPPFPEFSVAGGEPGTVQTKGTLAGEDVAYGTKPPTRESNGRVLDSTRNGYHGLFNVQRMKPGGVWSATWRSPDEDLSLTMTMPSGCTREVIIADGEPETQPGNPKTTKYVLGRNSLPENQTGADNALLTNFVAVVEPHKGATMVSGVQRLMPKSASPETVGLVVQRGGTQDLIHSSLNPDERCEWKAVAAQASPDKSGHADRMPALQPFIATGEFALVTVDAKGVQRACLVNGTLLRYGDFYIRSAPSPQGKVASVDHEHNAITLDVALPSPEAYRDAVMILGNDLHQTSYTIKEAKLVGGRTTVSFGDVLFIVGMGFAGKVDSSAKTIESATGISGYGRIDGGRHAGRWLYNEDKTHGFRIAAIEGNTFKLEGVDGDLGTIFKDTDGDGRIRYWISDIGPGDAFRLPATTFVRRLRPGQYEVQAMTEVKVTAPKR